MKPKIFIVLPVFNRIKYTKKCLSSIYKQKYKNFETILIDDGSTDNTSDFVNKKYPDVKIIKGDGNWWWTRSMYEGVELALKSAKPNDYVLELNNDLFFEDNYFDELINFSLNNKKSLVGSICVEAKRPKRVVEAGIRIDWPTGMVYGVAQTVSNDLDYYQNMNKIDNLDALPGKGTLVPVKVFKKSGNFDYKNFPHYIADYEFSARAKKNGFNLLVSPKAITKHFWRATGISMKKRSKTLSIAKAFNFLLGRKSMNNIIDWIRFVNRVCPSQHKFRNYFFSVLRIIKGIMLIKQLSFLGPLLRLFVRTYHIYLEIKLRFYRIYLKIKQFPKYHLK